MFDLVYKRAISNRTNTVRTVDTDQTEWPRIFRFVFNNLRFRSFHPIIVGISRRRDGPNYRIETGAGRVYTADGYTDFSFKNHWSRQLPETFWKRLIIIVTSKTGIGFKLRAGIVLAANPFPAGDRRKSYGNSKLKIRQQWDVNYCRVLFGPTQSLMG